MKKMFALLLALICLWAFTATAEDVWAPTIDAAWTDAAPEDFAGYWELYMVRSDGPVDIREYRMVEVMADGRVDVYIGNHEDQFSFEADMTQFENGFVYLADEDGAYGAYYFLFDTSLMGCVETLDNPGTLLYLAANEEMYWDDSAWRAERADAIMELIGDPESLVPADKSDLGAWQCWAYTSNQGTLLIMDPAMTTMCLTFAEGRVDVSSSIMGEEEDVITAELELTEEGARFYSEDSDTTYYIFLRGKDEMILLDDPYLPKEAMFFLTPERWAEEEATGAFYTGLELGDEAELTDLAQVVGLWEATHVDYLGYVQPSDDANSFVEVSADGTAVMLDSENSYPATCQIQDNFLILTDEDDYAYYFKLYENDVLVMAAMDADFSLAIYLQRVATSAPAE